MNIISAIYTDSAHTNIALTHSTGVSSVPVSGGNRDYQELLEWSAIDGNAIADYVAPDPTREDVSVERDRRIKLPISVTIGGVTFVVDMKGDSRTNIQNLTTKGMMLKMAGDDVTVESFRDAANVDHDLDADGLMSLGVQVGAQISHLHHSANIIKNGGNIPTNYANDSHWD